jgi:hypothetical protein
MIFLQKIQKKFLIVKNGIKILFKQAINFKFMNNLLMRHQILFDKL